MTELEKTVKGLECCMRENNTNLCGICPYHDSSETCFGCMQSVMRDALVLLRSQDEGVMPIISTIEQKEFADRIGLEVSDFWCGVCHFNLIGHPKFCQNCGKKVKWDG